MILVDIIKSKYRALLMDLADASLVLAAEDLNDGRILLNGRT